MVKLGSNLSDKLEKQPSADDGFDNIPLITPLEVNQLQQPFADKVSLILITLAFLTSLLLLLMYKAMWYDQLTCPEGFILKQKHCTPAALEMYYTEQQQQDIRGGTNTGLYTALSHLKQVKGTGPELPSPWLPVISALKEAEGAKQGNEPLKGVLEGEE
uniref:Calcyon neuron-specific vesicular protein n=1 Tax=Mastacembelus armatus TaxID=205130 RepID=A0A7N8XXM2_9TELE